MASIEDIINAVKNGASSLYEQGKKDVGTMGQPHALTDVANRGLVAGTLGAPVDLINMGLGAVGLGTDKPMLGSEHLGDLMERYGMVTPTRRPVLETAANLAPMLVDPALAAGKIAMRELGPLAGKKK